MSNLKRFNDGNLRHAPAAITPAVTERLLSIAALLRGDRQPGEAAAPVQVTTCEPFATLATEPVSVARPTGLMLYGELARLLSDHRITAHAFCVATSFPYSSLTSMRTASHPKEPLVSWLRAQIAAWPTIVPREAKPRQYREPRAAAPKPSLVIGDWPSLSAKAPREPVQPPRPSSYSAPFRRLALEEVTLTPAPRPANKPSIANAPSSLVEARQDRRAPRSGRLVENAAAALAYLRDQRISVSVASCTMFGSTWHVATYPHAFDAAGIVELATAKGFAG